jgi:hypothetical protein
MTPDILANEKAFIGSTAAVSRYLLGSRILGATRNVIRVKR